MKHHAHVLEEQLFECYLATRHGEAPPPALAEHLADCRPCAARYTELSSLLEDIRVDGLAEADAVFNADRLRLQQQLIARRLERVGQPARILSFPSRFVRRTMTATSSRPAPRWVAAGAAAGLFIGVVVGASYQYGAHGRLVQQTLGRPAVQTLLAPVATRGDSPAQIAPDDAFLSDLEVALERPHTRELLAFDALTPHVREISR